jgi:hypothetical protein
MNQDIIKIIAPIAIIALWLYFCRTRENSKIAGAALFFASSASFSQNFFFIFREVHQAIQMALIVGTLPAIATKTHKFNRIFLAASLLVAISYIHNPVDADATAQLINLAAVIGVTNHLLRSIDTQDKFSSIIKFIGQISIIISGIGCIERLLSINERIEVTFSNPNYLGLFLGIGYCCAQHKAKGIIKFLGNSLIIVAIILTGSRSALLLPIMMILWSAYKINGTRGLVKYFALCALSIGALLASGSSRLSDTEAGQASDAERLIFAGIAFSMATDHPFTGVGWGRFISEFENYSSFAEQIILNAGIVDVSSQDRRVTHNDLLRILAELGFVAFSLTIAILAIGAKKAFSTKNIYAIPIPPIWTGCILFSLTHNNLNTALFWYFFLLPFHLSNTNKTVPLKKNP